MVAEFGGHDKDATRTGPTLTIESYLEIQAYGTRNKTSKRLIFPRDAFNVSYPKVLQYSQNAHFENHKQSI
ncbi:unnamed protein product [Fusarium graminearum]|uniref:Chromosome 4, complete genome n=1 Tax=Gibberella zeae (strain ATCC MYA-4620 / CBS 123657 / FGSC 9075 / NRRL 31084 / PH-1) TaxID=229533 RepID=A0A098DTH3_GIBZE|nr:unnamed protein product [Fusarium graminearum]